MLGVVQDHLVGFNETSVLEQGELEKVTLMEEIYWG